MEDKQSEVFPWTHHGDYYKLARDNWKRILKLKREHDTIQKALSKKKNISDHEVDQLASRNDAIGEASLVVVIFCAFTLEAYINHYAITHLSANYHKKYLDKLDLTAKWVVIPKLVLGKQLDPGSRAMQDLGWLVSLRNKLAHYKSKTLTVDAIKDSDFLWYEDAERAIRTVRDIVLSLKRIDPEVEVDWVS